MKGKKVQKKSIDEIIEEESRKGHKVMRSPLIEELIKKGLMKTNVPILYHPGPANPRQGLTEPTLEKHLNEESYAYDKSYLLTFDATDYSYRLLHPDFYLYHYKLCVEPTSSEMTKENQMKKQAYIGNGVKHLFLNKKDFKTGEYKKKLEERTKGSKGKKKKSRQKKYEKKGETVSDFLGLTGCKATAIAYALVFLIL